MLLHKEKELVAELTSKLAACEKRLSEGKDSSVKDVEDRMNQSIEKLTSKNDKLK